MKNDNRAQAIKPGVKLYENIFCRSDYESIFGEISEGIEAIIANSRRLHEDVELLINSERYASGGFLLETADEEMAKVFILLDMCRLDFRRHESLLKNLCRGFYDHVAKYAYNKVVNFPVPLHDMKRVKEIWIAGITRYWPSGYESGEPDFPHQTYFHRELPLYVDFIEYDQQWHIPDQYLLQYRFDENIGGSAFSDSKKVLQRLSENQKSGFFSPEALSVLNSIFKNCIISEEDDIEKIIGLYRKVKDRMGDHLRDGFENSFLYQIPLYPFAHILR